MVQRFFFLFHHSCEVEKVWWKSVHSHELAWLRRRNGEWSSTHSHTRLVRCFSYRFLLIGVWDDEARTSVVHLMRRRGRAATIWRNSPIMKARGDCQDMMASECEMRDRNAIMHHAVQPCTRFHSLSPQWSIDRLDEAVVGCVTLNCRRPNLFVLCLPCRAVTATRSQLWWVRVCVWCNQNYPSVSQPFDNKRERERERLARWQHQASHSFIARQQTTNCSRGRGDNMKQWRWLYSFSCYYMHTQT